MEHWNQGEMFMSFLIIYLFTFFIDYEMHKIWQSKSGIVYFSGPKIFELWIVQLSSYNCLLWQLLKNIHTWVVPKYGVYTSMVL